MTSTTVPPSISSFDPQLLKLLAHHHHQQQQQQQQFSAKEYLQHAYFHTHPPPNAVATNLPRHLLGNCLSKLNTEKSTSNFKLPTSHNEKFEQQQDSIGDLQKKKYSIQQAKDALAFDQWLQPPPGSLIQGPICLPSDTSSSSSSSSSSSTGTNGDFKGETILSSGERITCFVVGGEKRLCLPEILNTVLKDFSLQEINAACERLHIYCSRCTTEQLDILKMTQVLPMNAPSCGLITQTDAERLCASLLQLRYKGQLRSVNSMGINPYERLYSIKVQHKCFGKCSGTLYPTLYVALQAECIQCDTCQALFSPKTFVSHGHKSEENRICHWGFNSDNWRAYLKIRSTEDVKAREELELVKEKFLNNNNNQAQNKRPGQIEDRFLSSEKAAAAAAAAKHNHYSFQPTAFSSVKKDNHSSEYPFLSRLPNSNNLIPSHKPTTSSSQEETTPSTSTCSRPTPLRVVRSNSPILDEPTNSSIINFNDFSANGIRHIVESTVASVSCRQRLLTYISQLQLAACKTNLNRTDNDSNETALLRRENELLRERLSKLESSQMSSNDSNTRQDSLNGDSDDLESNTSSSTATTTTTNDQPKYYDRKRRLLAAEQTILNDESKKFHSYKKACLDRIVDSLNQKAAQAEQEDNHDEKLIIIPDHNLTPPATTPERKQHDDDDVVDDDDDEQDIDIDEQQ